MVHAGTRFVVSFSLSNNETYLSISLYSRRNIIIYIYYIYNSIILYSRIMAITRSDGLCHSPEARDTSSQ
jgi:hypothetical protein